MAARWIAAQPVAHQPVETIEILAHVRRAGCNIYPRRRPKPEHRLRPVQYAQQTLQRFRIESTTHFDSAPASQLNKQNTVAPGVAAGIPRRRRDYFNRKQRSGPKLRPALHASTILIQRPHSKASLPAKRHPRQSTRFKLRNQRFDLGPTTPPPQHSSFAHNSSAPLNAAAEKGKRQTKCMVGIFVAQAAGVRSAMR